MYTLLIFLWVYAAMISMSFWEAYVEGRNAWTLGKLGWKIKIGKYDILSGYHFFLTGVMLPLLFTLPLVIYGWNSQVFGVLLSAYFSGLVIEDLFWFVVNPSVNFSEFWSEFTDYFLWIKIKGKKIIPFWYVAYICIAVASWWFLWRI